MKFIIREGLKKFKNYTKLTLATFITSTISYLVLSMFLMISLTLMEGFQSFQQSETKVVAFVGPSTPVSELQDIKEHMAKINGVNNIEIISNEQGLKNIESDFGKENSAVLSNIDENPLPHTFIINFDEKKYADEGAKILKKDKLISKVNYEQEYLEEINNTFRELKISLTLIVAGLVLSSIFFIMIVISLSIHNQRKNIKIMLLTGAPMKYISKPFVVQGMIISVLSSTTSSVLALSLYNEYSSAIIQAFPFLKSLNASAHQELIPVILISLSILLGCVGSNIAARKEIKKVIKNYI